LIVCLHALRNTTGI